MDSSELEEIGLVAIIRSTDTDIDFLAIANALSAGGILAMEVTLNTPRALQGIEAVRRANILNLRIGAGTVLDHKDAAAAKSAGSEFIVTPTLQNDTIEYCKDNSLPIASGSLTPTEALTAYRAGADFIKIFPADSLGPAYIKSLLGPLPFLKIIPTGGVSLNNIQQYILAGAVGVALGSNFVSSKVLREKDWPALKIVASEYVTALKTARRLVREPLGQ